LEYEKEKRIRIQLEHITVYTLVLEIARIGVYNYEKQINAGSPFFYKYLQYDYLTLFNILRYHHIGHLVCYVIV